jgi:hypothetical protein
MNNDLILTAASRPSRRRNAPKQTKVTVTIDAIAAVMAGRVTAEAMSAEAVRTARPEASKVLVDLGTIRWTDPKTGKRASVTTPATVREAMLDLGKGCSPAAFRCVLGSTTPSIPNADVPRSDA